MISCAGAATSTPPTRSTATWPAARAWCENVSVFFYNDGDVKGTLASLEALGGTVIQANPAQPDQAFYEAIVALDAPAFDAVARLGTVLWLGYSHPVPVLDDEMSSQILAGNYSGAGVPFTGYLAHLGTLGVNGSGVTLGHHRHRRRLRPPGPGPAHRRRL